MRAADDFGHPISVHKLTSLSFTEFADDPNIDQFAIQDNTSPSADELHGDMVTAFQDAAGRYNLNMTEAFNHGFGTIAREKNWAVAMGGAYVMVLSWDIVSTDIESLRDCGCLAGFMESTDFADMEPRDDLAFGGTQYVLANDPESYILYAFSLTGEIGVQGIAAGTYDFRWYDIPTGTYVDQFDIAVAGGDMTWPRPAGIGPELALWVAASGPPPPNQAPTAALIANPTSGDVPLPVSFDGNTSTDADGTIVSYDWDFGDGQTDTGAIVSHTYAAAGSFTVTLTVTDDDGATDTATTTITANDPPPPNQAPTAALIANPTSGDVPLPVSFDGNTSTDPDGTIVSYDWDFGDGQTDTGAIVSHTYDAVGSFTVTDDDGATDTATTTIAVNDPAAAYLLLVSLSSDRSAAIPLEGTTLSDDIYVFTSPDAGVQTTNANRVRFWLDDPAQSGSPIHSEKTEPYDFAGGSASTASPFDANSLVDGSHTITAALPLASGATEVIHATFVAVSAANLPPVLDPIGSQSLAEQQTLSVPVSATDPEGQPVALSAASLPPFASFVDNGDGTGSLNLAPTPGDAGAYAPIVSASDGNLIDSETVPITVTPANAPPSITQHPSDQTVFENQSATFSVTATGSSPLSYQWQRDGADIAGATNSSYTTPAPRSCVR